MSKDIEVVICSYEEFSEWDHIPYGSFYIRNAMGEINYFKTSDRTKAQEKCNEIYGEKRYTVIPTKVMKTKSRREDGGYSAVGSNTRKCFMKKS